MINQLASQRCHLNRNWIYGYLHQDGRNPYQHKLRYVTPVDAEVISLTHTQKCQTGVGVRLISFIPLFSEFSALWKHTLAIEYHVDIWHVPPQLSCGETYEIWIWIKWLSRCICKIKSCAYRKINELIFSNPHPWIGLDCICLTTTHVLKDILAVFHK